VKSNDANEGKLLAAWLLKQPAEERARLMVYGSGDKPLGTLRALMPDQIVMSRNQLKKCGYTYIALGWSGFVPQAGNHTLVLMPINMTWLAWGWPNRFLSRMEGVGSPVFVLGPYRKDENGAEGLNTVDDFRKLPAGYSGGIWTDELETIAPLIAGTA